MDKYEYRIKAEQIRKLAEQEDYVSAMRIANTIDWNRVRSIPMLCLIGEIYEKNDMLEESRDVMLIAYDRHPYGRMIIYSLAELSIRLEDYIDAVEYYKEFVQVAPRDTGRYILQYKLYEAQDVGIKERIGVLEEFKRHEYVEKWAFELAYLYHRAGMSDKCIAECDEIILWFSEGKYVEKAMELKMLYQPLTEDQQKKYDSRNDVQIEKSIAAVEAVAERSKEEETDINVKPLNYGIYDTVNLQKELAKSMQQILEATEKEDVDSTMDNVKQLVKESKIDGLVEEEKPGHQTKEMEVPEAEETEEKVLDDAEVVAEAAKLMEQLTSVSRRMQEDNVEEKEEVVEKVEDPIKESEEDLEKTKEFILHIADAPTKIIPTKDIERELQKLTIDKTEEIESETTVTTEQTEQIPKEVHIAKGLEEVVEESKTAVEAEEATEEPQTAVEAEEATEESQIVVEAEEATEEPQIAVEAEEVAEEPQIAVTIEKLIEKQPSIVTTETPRTTTAYEMPKATKEEDPVAYEKMLSEELDGQISICVPDADIVETQITGQMSIEEVLEEWERIKAEDAENKQKSLEEARAKAIAETEDIMDRLADVVPNISNEMQKMMEDRETETLKLEKSEEKEGGLKNILEEECVFEEFKKPEEPIQEEKIESSEEIFNDAINKNFTFEFGDLEEAIAKEAEAALKAIDEAENAQEEPEDELGELEELEELETEEDKALEVWARREEESEQVEKNVFDTFEEHFEEQNVQEDLDELDEFGKEEEPEDEDAVEELESKLSKKLPEGIISIAGEEEEEVTEPLEVGADSFKRIFKYFTEIEGVSDQIVDALEVIDEISDKGNLVIMGDAATGKTTLAIDIIKAAKKSRNITGNKIAKITGEAMNGKDMATVMESAMGGVLLIEGASAMNTDTVNKLSDAMDETQDNLLVIIEDVKEKMLKLLERNRTFRSKFPAKIDLPPYTNGDLVAFAKSYALEKECKIDEMGILALYSKLAEVQFETETIPSLADVKEMVDNAIEQSGKKNIKNIIANLVSKRYDDENYMILREKDFV
ncbi:MAG: hypothetical protein IJA36_02295 [Lachnospiraceae bacterium]|nr:hypothetical protein [Lachnospiraceae bacterium]